MGDRDGARAAWEEELALIDQVFEGDESAESESLSRRHRRSSRRDSAALMRRRGAHRRWRG